MNTQMNTYTETLKIFEDYLNQSLVIEQCPEKIIYQAMHYSLSAGGKRIRPVLLLLSNALFEKNTEHCLPFALAVEMIHTYSLIHDDLPCMDNDDLRRGKPTCHKAFSEDTAVLAGDALLNSAFELMIKTTLALTDKERGLQAMAVLGYNSGAHGMIGGQVLDMLFETQQPDETTLLQMYEKKTGALLSAPLIMGAILGGANVSAQNKLSDFGKNLGLAFQIQDDILDYTSTTEVLGKPAKSDEKNNKTTYVTLCGLQKSQQAVKFYTNNALSALSFFGEKADVLRSFTETLTHRNH